MVFVLFWTFVVVVLFCLGWIVIDALRHPESAEHATYPKPTYRVIEPEPVQFYDREVAS